MRCHDLHAPGLYPAVVSGMVLFVLRSALPPGARLEVLTDDPASPIDMRHFCATEGHDIVEAQEADAPYRFVIARAG